MAEQPTQKEFKAVDIVDYAMSSQPIRVNDAFDSIIADKVISIMLKKFKLDKVLDYVENPNDADERIDKLEQTVFQQGRLIEILLLSKDKEKK